MGLKLTRSIRNLVKATRFWKDNYLILREFKHFRRVAIFAVVFSLLAAVSEGITITFITSFVGSFTNPDGPPTHTGIGWFDVWFLGIN